MNVLITHYKKDEKDNTVYYAGAPVRQVTTARLPLHFKFGSYNEPKKVIELNINVEDVISIEAEGEMSR